jgi:hypothetical protein
MSAGVPPSNRQLTATSTAIPRKKASTGLSRTQGTTIDQTAQVGTLLNGEGPCGGDLPDPRRTGVTQVLIGLAFRQQRSAPAVGVWSAVASADISG